MTAPSWYDITSARITSLEERLEALEKGGKDAFSKAFSEYLDKPQPRVRAHVLTEGESNNKAEFISNFIKLLYRGEGFTHVDVYSSVSDGERLLYRVEL